MFVNFIHVWVEKLCQGDKELWILSSLFAEALNVDIKKWDCGWHREGCCQTQASGGWRSLEREQEQASVMLMISCRSHTSQPWCLYPCKVVRGRLNDVVKPRRWWRQATPESLIAWGRFSAQVRGACRTNTLVSRIREKLNLTVGERINCKGCWIAGILSQGRRGVRDTAGWRRKSRIDPGEQDVLAWFGCSKGNAI